MVINDDDDDGGGLLMFINGYQRLFMMKEMMVIY